MSTSIDGNKSLYDDDAITTNSVSVSNTDEHFIIIQSEVDEAPVLQKKPKLDSNVPVSTDAVFEIKNVQNAEMDVEKPCDLIIETPFDCSTPHSSLRKPIAPSLKRQIQKKQSATKNLCLKRP
ncbi:hypothetical protein evm_012728 [Chilo suppressalis]|nr:hypothetical protein evm_012728 [Chilo suppressalis]